MADTAYQIELGGEAVDDGFYGAVRSLTVAENTAAAGSLRLRLRMALGDDGAWDLLEDDRLKLFQRVKVSVGFTSGGGVAGALQGLAGGNDPLAPVFEGYLTAVAPTFDGEPDESTLEVEALDTSVLMGLEEKVAVWPNLSDADIVRQIVAGYGVRAVVDDTPTTHQENDTTVVQRGTDVQFVRDLARRNGVEFYFETDPDGGVTAYFRAPDLDATPQPDLAVRFGAESNLTRISVRLTGQRPLAVNVRQIDVKANEVNTGQAGSLRRTRLGARDLDDLAAGTLGGLVAPRDGLSQMLLLGPPTADPTELQTLAQAVRDEAGWCIEAAGEVNGPAYQAVLRPHRLVLVKGAGRPFSGKYYVTRVVHELTAEGDYTQRFEAVRNARDVDGSEAFGGGGGLGLSIPGV
jgi:phage protein D